MPYRWLLLVTLSIACLGARAATLVRALPSDDGSERYRVSLILDTPGDSVTIVGGTLLAWNSAGRLVHARPFSQQEFAEWAARRTVVGRGQSLIFGRTLGFAAGSDVTHFEYIFYGRTNAGESVRLVRPFETGRAETEPTTELAVRPVPDRVEAVRLPRTGRLQYGFDICLQEAAGRPVTITAVDWAATTADGQVKASGTLEEADLQRLAGGPLVVGPDNRVHLPHGALTLDAETTEPLELLLMVAGRGADREAVTALYRLPLGAPAVPPTGATQLRLPFRGAWRVRTGPGQPPHVGGRAYGYVFEALGRDGQPFAGEGSQVSDWYSHGQAVYAPAAGVVVAVTDQHADATAPLSNGLFGGGTGENYLVIKHGENEFSYLGGLQTGTFGAAVGQQVSAGYPLARVGNTHAGGGAPGLVYRLMAGSHPDSPTLLPVFGGYQHQAPGEPQAVTNGAPEGGDVVVMR